jgi:hypothetical protein
MKIDVDAADVMKKPTDSRGRFTLGSDYADKTVTVALVEVHDDENEIELDDDHVQFIRELVDRELSADDTDRQDKALEVLDQLPDSDGPSW